MGQFVSIYTIITFDTINILQYFTNGLFDLFIIFFFNYIYIKSLQFLTRQKQNYI